MPDNQRFRNVINELTNGDASELSKVSGVPYTTIKNYLSRGSTPGAKVIAKIKEAFPQLDSGYLLGSSNNILLSNNNEVVSKKNRGIPYFDLDITGGDIPVYLDQTNVAPDHYIDIFGFNKCTHAFPVSGHSMYPKICNGDIAIFQHLKDKSVIEWGAIYLIITDERRLLKQLKRGAKDGWVILASENKEFDDMDIPMDKILELFLYKGKIEKSQM